MQIPVNRDLRDYKVREIGNFSLREAGFIVASAVVGYGFYFLETLIFDGNYSLPTCMIIPAIILAFGFLKPQKMTLWQYITTVFVEQYGLPNIMIWESEVETDFRDNVEMFGEEYAPTKEYLEQVNQMYFNKEIKDEKNRKNKKHKK